MAKRGKIQGFEVAGDLLRPTRIKKYQYLYLIVCEDQNTEKTYFQGFEVKIPKETIFLQAVGTGFDPLGVVERSIAIKNDLETEYGRTVDAVWVVFDKDDANLNQTRIERFARAFELAAESGFKLAYTNEVFELWLLLHLREVDPCIPLPRKEVYAMIEAEVRNRNGYQSFVYVHGNNNILKVIAQIGDERMALKRAERLIKHHGSKRPIDCNPVTRVNELVKDLYSWIDYFAYESK